MYKKTMVGFKAGRSSIFFKDIRAKHDLVACERSSLISSYVIRNLESMKVEAVYAKELRALGKK